MPKRIEYDREMMDELCDLMYGPDHFLSLAAASARLGLGPKRVMRILIDVGFPVPLGIGG